MNIKNIFSFFKFHHVVSEERHPVNLPEISADKINPADIYKLLDDDTIIWAWYSITDKQNTATFLNMSLTGCNPDSFIVFRKIDKHIMKYAVTFDDKMKIFLRPNEVYKMSPSAVMDIFNGELKNAFKIYYDSDGLTLKEQAYVTDLTSEIIDSELIDKRSMIIGEEHFIKNSDIINESSKETE